MINDVFNKKLRLKPTRYIHHASRKSKEIIENFRLETKIGRVLGICQSEIKPGKRYAIVSFDENILEIPEDEIHLFEII